jgi:hypothetical protein
MFIWILKNSISIVIQKKCNKKSILKFVICILW